MHGWLFAGLRLHSAARRPTGTGMPRDTSGLAHFKRLMDEFGRRGHVHRLGVSSNLFIHPLHRLREQLSLLDRTRIIA